MNVLNNYNFNFLNNILKNMTCHPMRFETLGW